MKKSAPKKQTLKVQKTVLRELAPKQLRNASGGHALVITTKVTDSNACSGRL